jgi:hypothetical protein
VPKLAFKNFEPEQVWHQLVHFTERPNGKTLDKIDRFIQSEGFKKALEDNQE